MLKIKVLYFSNAVEEKVFNQVFANAKRTPSQAGQKYHNLTIDGFYLNDCEIENISIAPISKGTYSKKWFGGKKYNSEKYRYISMPNISVLRNLWIFFYVFFKTFFSGKRKEKVVICDVLNFTVSMAVILACKLTGKRAVGIVTDVPTKRADKVKNPIKKLYSKMSFGLLKKFNGYVFLTEEMNILINRKNRPYIVAEGLVDISEKSSVETAPQKYEKKVCLYAGSLKKIYGIEYLVKGFIRANIPDSERHVYGAGDFENELKNLCEQYENVKFFGIKPNSYVVEEEKKAHLLVNPRPTNEEYTKYSFPSKNMEYMVSGTPLLTTKLPGMPEEYNEYVFLIEHETEEGIKNALCEVFEHSSDELVSFGRIAADFVLDKKNNKIQVERILDLFKQLR